MKTVIGPYQTGQRVASSAGWSLHRGRDTRSDAAVWVRRTHTAPRRGAEARVVMRELADCPHLAKPIAVAGDGGALVVIDRVEAGRVVAAESAALDGDAQVRAAHDLAVAVDALHAAGYAHGGIDAWMVDVADDGAATLRGAAEASGDLDRGGVRRDVSAVVALIERLGDGAIDLRIKDVLARTASGKVGLAALIACTAGILGIEPTDRGTATAATAVTAARGLRLRGVRRDNARSEPPYARRHAAPQTPVDRRLIVGVAALLAGAVLAAIAFWPRASDSNTPLAQPQVTAAATSEPRWGSYLPDLYATRAEAFGSGDIDLLRQVFTEGSAQLRADAETIATLVSQKRTVKGFAPSVLEVADVQVSGDSAIVRVRDEIKPFEIVDPSGTAMPVEGRSAGLSTLSLKLIDGAWLIDTATRQP